MRPSSDDVEIRKLPSDALDDVAAIHVEAFPDSALTLLGREAVRRYYEWQFIGPHDLLAFGAFRNERLIGYIFGGVFRGAMKGFVRRNWAFLMVCVLCRPWLLAGRDFRNRFWLACRILARGVRNVLSVQLRRPQDEPTEAPRTGFGLLAMAVSRGHRGAAALLLLKKSEESAREGGFDYLALSVDTRNTRLQQFYRRLGFQPRLINGEWAGSMRKTIVESRPNRHGGCLTGEPPKYKSCHQNVSRATERTLR